MESDCLFCKIVAREVPGTIIYEDNDILAFNDINPQAPVHILIIPKTHYSTVNDFQEIDTEIIGKLMLVSTQLAKKYKIEENGYRLLVNCNKDGGQAVYHVHFHLLGGRQMTWPPG